MDVLIDQRNAILDGFWETIQLLVLSGLIATVLGTVLGAMRVAPVRAVNAIGTSYVNLFRNTPLVVMFILVFFGLPELGIQFTFFEKAVIALSVYTAAFVCEAVRSGINTVPTGQAEAARSVGMTFNQTLGRVVLPQAFRAVVPPMASVYIALAKNTSVAAAFGITELTYELSRMNDAHVASIPVLFFTIAACYIAIVWALSAVSATMERQVATSR
jgi:glutamate transport system permease protein